MRIQSIPATDKRVKQPQFKGMAKPVPTRRIYNAIDAMAQWDILKHPKYTEIFQDDEPGVTQYLIRQNQQIRNSNYSFLDELTSDVEKAKFIEYFKKVTGFPYLQSSSKKILEEFRRVLAVAGDKLSYKRPSYAQSGNSVIISGYDKFCSVGLGHALPGSDLDKGYAIVRGVDGNFAKEREYSNLFKGIIWENIDNRIMSVNHNSAFPNIVTEKEFALLLERFDKYARRFVSDDNINFFRFLRMENGNPISGAKFNIWLSEEIPSFADKAEAKNLAYIAEAVRDGNVAERQDWLFEEICQTMNNSIFGHCSNVTQGYKMQEKYDFAESSMVKKKLKARQEVERTFNSWSIREQYELIKDIIRSMSGDSKNPDFRDLFHSGADRHRLLINDILKGKARCQFQRLPNGAERTYLSFDDPEMFMKYRDFDVYDTKY